MEAPEKQPASAERPGSDVRGTLVGWKAIAAYLDVSRRSAQTFEKKRGMPVHRLNGLESVFAYREELDEWRSACSTVRAAASPRPRPTRSEPWVGRGRELDTLQGSFRLAAGGQTQMVLVSGQSGVGKTSLIERFLADLGGAGTPFCLARARCCEGVGTTGAYLPLIDALEDLLECEESGRVKSLVKRVAPTWWAELFGDGVRSASPSERGTRLNRELTALLREVPTAGPVLLFFDDLHWSDDSTLAILARVIKTGGLRLLIVGTLRPFDVGSGSFILQMKRELHARGLCVEIPLESLGHPDLVRYLDLAFSQHRFPGEFSRVLGDATGGNPFFFVESLRYLQGQGIVSLIDGAWQLTQSVDAIRKLVPPTIRSLLDWQINPIPDPDRSLLVAASVQGMVFDAAIVANALCLEAARVEERLGQLSAFVRFERERQLPSGLRTAHYRFAHGFYKEHFYASLTPARKAQVSAEVARALLDVNPDPAPAIALQLAQLYEASGDIAAAVEYVMIAAQNAARVFAHREAAEAAQKGRQLISILPQTPDKLQREFTVLNIQGLAVMATRGYATPELNEIYSRAQIVSEQTGEQAQQFRALFGHWIYCLDSGEMHVARRQAQQLLEMAVRGGENIPLVEAHYALGVTELQLGSVSAAAEHLRVGMLQYQQEHHLTHVLLYLLNPAITCRCHLARALWFLGFPDQALAYINEALELSPKLGHAESTCYAYLIAADVHHLRGESAKTAEHLGSALQVAKEHELATESAWAEMLWGWALGEQGQVKIGVDHLRRKLADYRASGGRVAETKFLCLLGQLLAKAGEVQEAVDTIEDALARMESTGERYFEAELRRVYGELLLLRSADATSAAETHLDAALVCARAQGLRSLELRAACSLAHMWRGQSRAEEAANLLTAAVAGISEGRATRDVCVARELLTGLTSGKRRRPALKGVRRDQVH